MEDWIRIDEEREAVSSLEITFELLKKVPADPYYWKWVIICVHNSLQAFMILALKSTNSFGVLKESTRSQIAKSLVGNSTKPPKIIRIEDFMRLYEKIKDPGQMKLYYNSCEFRSTPSIDSKIRQLNEWRNIFVHFHPQGLSIFKNLLPGLVYESLKLIDFLLNESGNIFFSNEQLASCCDGLLGDLMTLSIEFEQTYRENNRD